MIRHAWNLTGAVIALAAVSTGAPAIGTDDPFADLLVSFDAGQNPHPSYRDPVTALGQPERFTGEDVFPGVISAFKPAWGADEIVSIGAGGSLVVGFDTPVTDDPRNPYGVDLLIFGNAGFTDAAWPNGIVGSSLFGADGGTVEVSADGVIWIPVPAAVPDDLFPTIGYRDAGPYDEAPGSAPTQLTKPVDPVLTLADFIGLDNDGVIGLYGTSGGGNGIDLGALGLAEISFVRISNPIDATEHIEIDALADVTPAGDINEDGAVNVLDLIELLLDFGATSALPLDADLDGDGTVNVLDLIILLLTPWG